LMSIINPHPHLVNISFLECLVDDVGYLPDNIDFLLDVEFLQPSEFDIATADYLLGAQMHVSKKTVRDVKDIIPGIIQNRYNSGDFDESELLTASTFASAWIDDGLPNYSNRSDLIIQNVARMIDLRLEQIYSQNKSVYDIRRLIFQESW